MIRRAFFLLAVVGAMLLTVFFRDTISQPRSSMRGARRAAGITTQHGGVRFADYSGVGGTVIRDTAQTVGSGATVAGGPAQIVAHQGYVPINKPGDWRPGAAGLISRPPQADRLMTTIGSGPDPQTISRRGRMLTQRADTPSSGALAAARDTARGPGSSVGLTRSASAPQLPEGALESAALSRTVRRARSASPPRSPRISLSPQARDDAVIPAGFRRVLDPSTGIESVVRISSYTPEPARVGGVDARPLPDWRMVTPSQLQLSVQRSGPVTDPLTGRVAVLQGRAISTGGGEPRIRRLQAPTRRTSSSPSTHTASPARSIQPQEGKRLQRPSLASGRRRTSESSVRTMQGWQPQQWRLGYDRQTGQWRASRSDTPSASRWSGWDVSPTGQPAQTGWGQGWSQLLRMR